MIESDDKKRKRAVDEEEDSGSGEESGGRGSRGGSGGSLEFKDFLAIPGEKKLSAEEEKQLLAAHKETNGGLVEKQKKLRDQRQEKKEGKTVNSQYQYGGMDARNSSFLKHPILGEAAEFDGVDPQVNLDPTIYDAETNSEKKEELTYQHQLRLGLDNQPRFNPKPSPF